MISHPGPSVCLPEISSTSHPQTTGFTPPSWPAKLCLPKTVNNVICTQIWTCHALPRQDLSGPSIRMYYRQPQLRSLRRAVRCLLFTPRRSVYLPSCSLSPCSSTVLTFVGEVWISWLVVLFIATFLVSSVWSDMKDVTARSYVGLFYCACWFRVYNNGRMDVWSLLCSMDFGCLAHANCLSVIPLFCRCYHKPEWHSLQPVAKLRNLPYLLIETVKFPRGRSTLANLGSIGSLTER